MSSSSFTIMGFGVEGPDMIRPRLPGTVMWPPFSLFLRYHQSCDHSLVIIIISFTCVTQVRFGSCFVANMNHAFFGFRSSPGSRFI